MNVCTRCGATNQPTSKFCLSCGNPLAAPAPAPVPVPAYGPPQASPPAAVPAPAWGPPPAPSAGAPQPLPQGWPPPGVWPQSPSDPNAFTAASAGSLPQAERARIGTPEGMNPFGATVGPDFGPPARSPSHPPPPAPAYAPPPAAAYAPAYAPPPAAAYAPAPAPAYAPPPAPVYAPPPAQAYVPPPPPGYGSSPGAPQPVAPGYAPPAPAYASPPGYAPAPIPGFAASAASAASPQPSHDPSAYAPTAPPPTPDEHDAPGRGFPASGVSRAAAISPPVPPGRDPEHVEASAIRALAGFLVSYDKSEFGVFWPLYQGQNVLGRKAATPGLDIEIDSPTTSSRHAVVYASARPGRLKVEDAGSTNGTFLNETQLDRGKKFELRDGDALRFGGFNVTVKII